MLMPPQKVTEGPSSCKVATAGSLPFTTWVTWLPFSACRIRSGAEPGGSMGVSIVMGYPVPPNGWLMRENPIEMDDLGFMGLLWMIWDDYIQPGCWSNFSTFKAEHRSRQPRLVQFQFFRGPFVRLLSVCLACTNLHPQNKPRKVYVARISFNKSSMTLWIFVQQEFWVPELSSYSICPMA